MSLSKRSLPEQLNSEYYKARKMMVLVSALLFGWEFIGIKIDNQPFKNYNFRTEYPESAPILILCTVTYFIIRLLIEWYHCPKKRRGTWVSRIDLIFSLSIASLAILIFAIQQLFTIQISESFSIKMTLSFIFGVQYLFGATVIYIEHVINGTPLRNLYNVNSYESLYLIALIIALVFFGVAALIGEFVPLIIFVSTVSVPLIIIAICKNIWNWKRTTMGDKEPVAVENE